MDYVTDGEMDTISNPPHTQSAVASVNTNNPNPLYYLYLKGI